MFIYTITLSLYLVTWYSVTSGAIHPYDLPGMSFCRNDTWWQ